MSNITVTNIDPGEGSPLSSDNFIAVYGQNSLLDIFYPVGSYYETSNTSFDPNTAWGGVWLEDTSGRMTVALEENSTDFNTVGNTGGNTTNTHQHWGTSSFDGSSFYATSTTTRSRTKVTRRINITGSAGNANTREDSTYEETINIMNPYVVVKRWHRTA